MTTLTAQHTSPTTVDLSRYAGKWFVIAVIPTRFDKHWNYITETYTMTGKEKIGIYTTYIKEGEAKQKDVRSRGFPDKKNNNISWKVQFVWPFKADYVVEELADDYSVAVVGHPKKKFLYIMNRTGNMNEAELEAIFARCRQKGYDLKNLRRIKQ